MLIAELLLHRTRAENVVPVYNEFIQKIPDIEALSLKSASEIQKIAGSLGLEWRLKLMIKMAEVIVNRFRGQIPCDLEQLKQLPGVGEYIASAMLIFYCGRLLPLLDTNTVRITGRYFDLEQSDGSRKTKEFQECITYLIDPKEVSESYYALIDLGAMICKPANPECQSCPLREHCNYFNKTNKGC